MDGMGKDEIPGILESEGKSMKGLIIKEPWIDLILDGKKPWEIRGSNTKIRGKICLIKSGSGLIVGECEIVNSKLVSHESLIQNQDKHCIDIKHWSQIPYRKPHAWVMQNPVRYKEPIPYKHPQGAVIWVNLDEVRERA
jgi:hypothetical protein